MVPPHGAASWCRLLVPPRAPCAQKSARSSPLRPSTAQRGHPPSTLRRFAPLRHMMVSVRARRYVPMDRHLVCRHPPWTPPSRLASRTGTQGDGSQHASPFALGNSLSLPSRPFTPSCAPIVVPGESPRTAWAGSHMPTCELLLTCRGRSSPAAPCPQVAA